MTTKGWQRSVPVYTVPVWTKAMYALVTLSGLAIVFSLYREVAGLGPSSGMNDAYAWGIWKTFNVMVLTGLGSGGFAVGIAAWVFGRHRLHTVMRTALLTSFLAYAAGLIMLGIDVGRPWNFIWIAMPWHWNLHSPLLEVAFCITIYATIPLALENVPPILEWFYDHRPDTRPTVNRLTAVLTKFYAVIVALAYVLPAMHQSSLGALMLLAGGRVSPLWQSPWLPLLYVWAAAFLGYSCVSLTLLLSSILWKRAADVDVLSEMAKITAGLITAWTAFRFVDLWYRGTLKVAYDWTRPAGLFWLETIVLGAGAYLLWRAGMKRNLRLMFNGHVIAALGGMLYRFSPTTLAFQPRPEASYFPSAIEIVISIGFASVAMAAFLYGAKVLAIVPAPLEDWYAYVAARDGAAAVEPIAARKLPKVEVARMEAGADD